MKGTRTSPSNNPMIPLPCLRALLRYLEVEVACNESVRPKFLSPRLRFNFRLQHQLFSLSTGARHFHSSSFFLRTNTSIANMTGPPNKRQKRDEYRKAQAGANGSQSGKIELPKKKFYRQRAHANPFSDHALT